MGCSGSSNTGQLVHRSSSSNYSSSAYTSNAEPLLQHDHTPTPGSWPTVLEGHLWLPLGCVALRCGGCVQESSGRLIVWLVSCGRGPSSTYLLSVLHSSDFGFGPLMVCGGHYALCIMHQPSAAMQQAELYSSMTGSCTRGCAGWEGAHRLGL